MNGTATTPPTARLAIVLSHPTQYYSPWFQWMAKNTSLDFRVFYLWDFGTAERHDPKFGRPVKWDSDLVSGYAHEFVANVARDPGTHRFGGLDNPALPSALERYGPAAILLFGYAWKSHLRTLWWARRRKIPVILRGDSHRLGRAPESRLRGSAMKFLLRQFAAFAYVGAANRDFYRGFGVPESKLHFAPHAVQAANFDPENAATKAEAQRLRGALGIAGRRVVLFAGKFLPAKQPVELLKAFHAVANDRHALVFVGDGELRPELESLASRRADRLVRILPFANQSEMPSRYRLADLFALPSRGLHETWGLAVNEAMHLGVPCLVTDRVGCQRDLVTPGETGWVFPALDFESLQATLQSALNAAPSVLAEYSANARRRADRYTFPHTTAGLISALNSIVAAN